MFGKVVGYEYCQVQLYMHMLKKPEADLVESYSGDINVYPIEYDEGYVDEVLQKLSRVDSFMYELQESKSVQNDYFMNRDEYVNNRLHIP